MKGVKYILMCWLFMAVLSSCNDDEPYSYGDFSYDMVTYAGENGGNSVFTFQSYNDSPLITLTAANLSRPGLKVGQRLLLNYIVNEDLGGNSKNVEVKGFLKVNTDTVTILPQETIDTLKCNEVKIKSVWRTGNYLNVRCLLEYTEKPRRLFLASTGLPDESGMIQSYQIQDLMGAQTFYWFETYLSYYIEPVWESGAGTGLRYNVVDLTYPDVKYYDFLK